MLPAPAHAWIELAAATALLFLPCAAAGSICAGDCDGDGAVTIDELVLGVDIALGDRPLSGCINFDESGDGAMTIDECLSAVDNALRGCPAPSPATVTETVTASATPTGTATATSTASATETETATATATSTDTATETATPTVTETATATATATPTATATATGTATGTSTATETATPTVTETATASATETPTATATTAQTDTQAATPSTTETPTAATTSTWTASPTFTPTATRVWTATPSGPTPTPEPLSQSCLEGPAEPLTARKAAAQTLRWLRDWATCLERSGYRSAACEVRLDRGANATAVLRQTGTPMINELVCNEARCTQDLGRSLDHCQGKFTYQGDCTLDDWDKVWRWVGDPPLPLSGTCSGPGAATCLVDADCAPGEVCDTPSYCDVYKFAPTAWEPCRCIQEAFIKPQIDEWLVNLRAMAGGPTPQCAAAALNTMGEAIGYMIDAGCMDPTDRSCLAAVGMCAAQWAALPLRNNCGTCALAPGGQCPSRCDGAQIDCATWMSWCASAAERFTPLRLGTRQLPGGL